MKVHPPDPSKQRTPSDDEAQLLEVMKSAYQGLRDIGWRDADYAPCDRSIFLAIEVGSTGLHYCWRDKHRRFWIDDGDVWPSRPILFKPVLP